MSIFKKHHWLLLWLIIGLYIIIFSSICIYKYSNFGYNALDLAIINQVFYNSAHGQLLAASIHEPSYLADHFNPIVLLLLPFYLIYQSPITLLILQTIFLALAAWPLYLIAKSVFAKPEYYLLLPFAYLFNPFIHNINLYEFHLVPLAVFLLFFAYYFYQKRQFYPFVTFIILALMTREDVSLYIFCLALFIIVDCHKHQQRILWSWVTTLVALSIFWFWASLKIIASLNPAGNYKFLFYYGWLGNSIPEIIKNIFSHPLLLLSHLSTYANLEMVLGFLTPFLFLPLLNPHYLILLLGNLAQMTIGGPGGGALVFQTHYGALFVIPLFIATVYSLKLILTKYHKHRQLIIILWLVTNIYNAWGLGIRIEQADAINLKPIKQEFLNQIPPQAAIAATYEFLPPLSSRPTLYSLHYAFIGKHQYSNLDYQLPADTEYLLIDSADFITYDLQFNFVAFYQPFYSDGAARLRQTINQGDFGLVKTEDLISLWQKNYPSDQQQLYTITESQPPADIFTCYQPSAIDYRLPISCQFQTSQMIDDNYELELVIKDSNDQTIYSRFLPFAYGLYQANELKPDELISFDYSLVLPEQIQKTADQITINLVKISGGLEISDWRGVKNMIDQKEIIQTITLP
ncbi:MAG: DUF2079 domain-containing protein [Patescibacteria group bacterium]